jgi:hypothetical protein
MIRDFQAVCIGCFTTPECLFARQPTHVTDCFDSFPARGALLPWGKTILQFV